MFLSGQIEFTHESVKDTQLHLSVFDENRINHPDSKPLQVSPLYEKIRENVVNAELLVLRGAGFYLSDYKPHAVCLIARCIGHILLSNCMLSFKCCRSCLFFLFIFFNCILYLAPF